MFPLRPNFCCVENVTHGFNPHWEADLLVCSMSGYLTEVEIKVTFQDWKIDKFKTKFSGYGGQMTPAVESWWRLIKNFYYAAPMDLAKRWPEIGIPDWAGVIGIPEQGNNYVLNGPVVLRPCVVREHKKLTDAQKMKLARLGSMRAWN